MRDKTRSAGGQLEQPSEVKSSTTTTPSSGCDTDGWATEVDAAVEPGAADAPRVAAGRGSTAGCDCDSGCRAREQPPKASAQATQLTAAITPLDTAPPPLTRRNRDEPGQPDAEMPRREM